MKKKLSCLLMVLFMFVYTGACAAKLAPGDFIDIKGHWAEQEIQTTVKLGLMSGMGSNAQGYQVFAPDSQLNRAQLAVVLQRVFQLDYGQIRFIKQPEASDYFGDVDNDSWYADALVMCAINNIFDNSGCFNPDENVSRIEVARSINRAFNAKGISVPMIQVMPQFTDTQDLVQEDTNAMVFVNNTGIMTGYNGCFRPHDPVKRGELASVLNRCASLLSMNENDSGKTCTVGVGKTFNLSLDSNPTTGYVWTLSDTWDKTILNLAGKDYYSQANKNVVGQGGQEIFTFKALKSGKTEINLFYSRPWESVQPLKKFTVQIEVKDNQAANPVNVQIKEIKSSSETLEVDLNVPRITGMTDAKAQEQMNQSLEQKAIELQNSLKTEALTSKQESEQEDFPFRQFGLYSRCPKYYSNDQVLSFYVDYYTYTGGAHGLTDRVGYNYRMSSGSELKLSDLFNQGYDYKTVLNEAIAEKIKADPEKYFNGELGFQGITEKQGFYLDSKSLIIFFNPYEIAPYAAGIPEFYIPLNDFGSGLKQL